MKADTFKVGDRVELPPHGPYAGNRIGIIISFSTSPCNPKHFPALVRYTDHPTGRHTDALETPIRKI